MLRIMIFVISLSAGGAAAWLTTSAPPAAMPPAAEISPALEIATEEVLVASADLAQGGTISETNVRWQSWPKEAVSTAFILRSQRPGALEDLAAYSARTRIVAGEPILEEKLTAPGAGFLSATLRAGKRAVAVRVTAENTAGGFILPNDRVDVLHTLTVAGADGPAAKTVSRTILRNVQVLAIDQMSEEAKTESVVGKTATLELDMDQVETIASAQASGTLSLALRPSAETAEEVAEEPQEVVAEVRKTIRVRRAGQLEIVEIN